MSRLTSRLSAAGMNKVPKYGACVRRAQLNRFVVANACFLA
jgi:hypothetical protein